MRGRPTLYIFSGLPGSGKTTLAKGIAARFAAVYLRIDTIEQGRYTAWQTLQREFIAYNNVFIEDIGKMYRDMSLGRDFR